MIERHILQMEIRHFFCEPRSLVLLPLGVLSALVALWPYVGSPFVPVVLATFAILEPTYNNILFRSRHEFESLFITPVSWNAIILGKNCASLLLTFIVATAIGLVTVYFSFEAIPLGECAEASVFLWAVSVPMIMAGNIRSYQSPRRVAGWSFTDIAEILITVVMLAMCSFVVMMVRWIDDSPVVLIGVGLVETAVWIGISVPATAKRIALRSASLCRIS
jgi:hypothetical protein